MADNVHWLRDTYGPALRAFYGDLLKQPVPQRFVDLIASLEAQASPDATSPPTADSVPVVEQREPQPDASE
jgi:anti-sigma factor NepR-like protein